MRRVSGSRGALLVAAAVAVGSSGCAIDAVERNESQVILRPISVSFGAGTGGTGGTLLLSDVQPNFNDNATVTLEAVIKNQNLGDLGNLQDVILERYEVRFFRTDGRNTEGVDIPYRHTGALSGLVPAGGSGAASFIVVRHQAKEEPPLRNLIVRSAFVGEGQLEITAIVEMTIHGRTTAGDAVSAVARGTVTFADFGDD